jgi:hypothetical protein
MSNDRRQIEIERQLRKLNYCYVRKRQTKGEARRSAGVHNYRFIKKEELAQAVAACDLDPVVVREGKENLFDEQYYRHVFPTADPYYYLSRYCTMAVVTYSARGYPQRSYAKWVVLNFLWSYVEQIVRNRHAAECYHQSWFRIWESSQRLTPVVEIAFNAVLHFYRTRRGKGAKAIDPSTFFKRRNLHIEFGKFWAGPANRRRSAFRRAWTRYQKMFAQEVEEA